MKRRPEMPSESVRGNESEQPTGAAGNGAEHSQPIRGNDSAPEELIAARAYEIFLERGGVDGRDIDDWLQAESEISPRQVEPSGAQLSQTRTSDRS